MHRDCQTKQRSMPYVTRDGSIAQARPRHPIEQALSKVWQAFSELSLAQKAAVGVFLVLACRRFLEDNPLANGKIPASDLPPEQHWDRISKDDMFVRAMVKNIGKKHKTAGEATVMNHRATKGDLTIAMGYVDFGGPNGHVFETMDLSDMESYRGTRCSSTMSALTAYFCGANVAENMDVGLGAKAKMPFFGVRSFSDFLSCRHEKGKANQGNHRRSVYRIGIGTQDSLAGYSHAFNIVAQPDGTYHWLQSFIGHYSLRTWMERTDAFGKPLGKLTLEQLQEKLTTLERLMDISEWTPTANQDYLDLFGVDKESEARNRGRGPVQLGWKPSHRLSSFIWDEACEFPAGEEAEEIDTEKKGSDLDGEPISVESGSPFQFDHFDDCSAAAWATALTDSLALIQEA